MSDLTNIQEQASDNHPTQDDGEQQQPTVVASVTPDAVQTDNLPQEIAGDPQPAQASSPTASPEAPPAAEPLAAAPAPSAPAPAAPAPAAPAPAEPAVAEPVLSEEERAEQAKKKAEERARKEEEKKRREEAYAELEAIKAANGSFEIDLLERVKGGLRGDYKGLRVFLPASHFGLRKNVSEEELTQANGQRVKVKVHELQSDETGYKSAVVTRRDILLEEFWGGITPGAVFEGIVTSVTPFGAFVNIGGVEGLVHVSRLSKSRIESPNDVVKKGDKLKVSVADVDREKHKLSLSHKEHEESAWKGVESTYPIGKRVKGTVRRITDFGAYVQVAPRIEGLLRISELSWTQRVKHPSDVVAVGQEIDVEILGASEEKQQLSLGYKQTQPNPWQSILDTFGLGTETQGVVQQVSTQGAVIRVAETFDGFMPRSKMLSAGRGKKVPIELGQTIRCVVSDVNPESSSLILAMKSEDGIIGGSPEDAQQHGGFDNSERGNHGERGERGNRGDRRDRADRPDRREDRGASAHPAPVNPGVTLGDMLKDADKSNLFNG